jgi:uncharacterized membrane protein HdeD (DUF308 family)
MFVAPGSPESQTRQLAREFAESVARNWWVLLVNGLLLVVAGVLIFSIDWSVRSLSIFIGALFILQGIATAALRSPDRTAQTTNIVAGLFSIAAGVAIMVWPSPGLTVVAVFLGSWLIVMGTITITGSFAGRDIIHDWFLWLIGGVLEVALGALALADPGSTLAALVTVAGIWAVVLGVMSVVMSFQVKRLPDRVDKLELTPDENSRENDAKAEDNSSYDIRPRTRAGQA